MSEYIDTVEQKMLDLEKTHLSAWKTIPAKRAWLDGYLACLHQVGLIDTNQYREACTRLSLIEDNLRHLQASMCEVCGNPL